MKLGCDVLGIGRLRLDIQYIDACYRFVHKLLEFTFLFTLRSVHCYLFCTGYYMHLSGGTSQIHFKTNIRGKPNTMVTAHERAVVF